MSDSTVKRSLEDLLPKVQRPARLIGGESGSSRGFSGHVSELRVVLGFPDTYEIGISNQALQILYHLARQICGVGVERTYLPWVDAIARMREEGIPLLTLETWTPVAAADFLGLTLQHESNFTNVLEMLDLAEIPLHPEDRDERHPLVVVGGPACANFLPMAAFVDAVAVGDGEEMFAEILSVLKRAKEVGATRVERRRRLSEVAGIYVPGISRSVTRRCLPRLQDAPYPVECIVPLTEGVHDRAWVEVMRGCTRGCRFCQAGMWYRPVRERTQEQALQMASAQTRSTGYQEVAFASLSTTDYSCIEGLLAQMAASNPDVRVSLPSLRVDSAAVRLAGLASPSGPSLTLAPEAGSQRMRDIMNKNVTGVDILGAVEEAARAGKTTLKLYFMIGLPWEEDEDAIAIADLCLQIRETARKVLAGRANRLALNVSVNNFIPKPFTPFQWAGMADRDTLARRRGLIRDRLRKPGIRVTFSGTEAGYLEAALARGDESMGPIVEAAWRRGARLDSWTEEFRRDAWEEAFASLGTSAEEMATTTMDPDKATPWDVIEGSVGSSFLRAEWLKASRGELTQDCRWQDCNDCGVCVGSLSNVLAECPGDRARRESDDGHTDAVGSGIRPDSAAVLPDSAVVSQSRNRYVAVFSVTGRGRFLGHLDRAEVLRRAVRRAGGHLALSAGMRPKALLSLALPLAVGVEGLQEMVGFELAEPPSPDFAARLRASLPAGMDLQELSPYQSRRSLAARVIGASFDVWVDGTRSKRGLVGELREAAARFAAATRLMVSETREGRTREIDVRYYVGGVTVRDGGEGTAILGFRTNIGPSGAVRPERVVEAVGKLAELDLNVLRVVRTEIHLSEDGE